MLDGTWKKFTTGRPQVGGTGRIKFGTESNGGFKNISISNCVFEGCQGLALETVDGALLEDITVTNITMRDISVARSTCGWAPGCAAPRALPEPTRAPWWAR